MNYGQVGSRFRKPASRSGPFQICGFLKVPDAMADAFGRQKITFAGIPTSGVRRLPVCRASLKLQEGEPGLKANGTSGIV
jgi:hypothetical protein